MINALGMAHRAVRRIGARRPKASTVLQRLLAEPLEQRTLLASAVPDTGLPSPGGPVPVMGIGSLVCAPDPVYAGQPVVLRARDVLGLVQYVEFYAETDGVPGLQVGQDAFLGMDWNGWDGWSVMAPYQTMAGSYTYYAVARYADFQTSNVVQATGTVQPPSIGSLAVVADPMSASSSLTLVAQDVLGPAQSVAFFRESNGIPGLQQGQDMFIGGDAYGADGWSVPVNNDPMASSYTYYAVAVDWAGNVGKTTQTTITIPPPSLHIGALVSDVDWNAGMLTLTALNVLGPAQRVDFFLETDGIPGLQTGGQAPGGGDLWICSDWYGGDSWSASVPVSMVGPTYTCYAVASDWQDNRGNTVQTSNVVPEPVSIGSLAISPYPVQAGDAFTLTAQDVLGPVGRVEFYRESNGLPGLEPCSDTTIGFDADGSDGWSVSVPGDMAAGTYTYYARAYGANSTPSNPAEVTLAVQPPTLGIGSLTAAPGQVWERGVLVLTVHDVYAPPQRVDFYLETSGIAGLQPGQDILIGSDQNGEDGWSVTWPVGVPAGVYTYYAVAIDNAGHHSNTVSTTGRVQLSAASIVSFVASPDPICAGDMLTLTASGDASQVFRVDFYMESNGVPGLQIGQDVLVGWDQNAWDGLQITVPGGPVPGTYTYYAVATDWNLNQSDPVATTSTVLPPRIGQLSISPEPAYAGQPLTLMAQDIAGSPSSVEFFRESNGVPGLQIGQDVSIGFGTSGTDGWSLGVNAEMAAGDCTYYAVASDGNGNRGDAAEAIVTVQGPSIGSLSVTPNSAYAGEPIKLTPSNVLGPVYHIGFFRETNGIPGLQIGDDTLVSESWQWSGDWSAYASAGMTVGTDIYYAVAVDPAGNLSNVVQTTCTVMPPSIGSLTVTPDSAYAGEPMKLTPTNVLGPVYHIAFYRESNGIPGLQVGSDIPVGDSWQWSGDWPAPAWAGMTVGTDTYYAVAVDWSGNQSNAVQATVTVMPPSIGSLSVTPDSTYAGEPIKLMPTNVLGPVYHIAFYRESNGIPGLQTGSDLAVGDSWQGSGDWSTYASAGTAVGTDTYYAVAVDPAGNLSNVVQTTCTVMPPSAGSLSATPDPICAGAPLTLTASNVLGPVLQIVFFLESNGIPGFQPGQDTQLGSDRSGADGWSILTTSGSSPGTYTYCAVAFDYSGNASNVVQTTSTVQPPGIGALSASADPVYAGVPLTLTASGVVGPVQRVVFFVQSSGIPGFQLGPDNFLGSDWSGDDGWSILTTSELSAGTYTYYAVAVDYSGNASNVVQTTSTVLPPSIGALSIAPTLSYAGDLQTLTESGVLGGVWRVQFFTESNGIPGLQIGQDQLVASDTDGSDGWSVAGCYGWRLGTHTYYAIADDGCGNYSNVAVVTSELLPPSIGSLTITPDPIYAGEPQTLTASHVLGPVQRVDFYMESNGIPGFQLGPDNFLGSDSNGSDGWSIPVPTRQVSGTYTYYAVAFDRGNASDIAQTTSTVQPPSIGSFTATPDPICAGASLTLKASNVQGPAQCVCFFVETNGEWGYLGLDWDGSDGWSFTVPSEPAPGTYTYHAIAVDHNGNNSDIATTTSTVVPPTVTSVIVNDGSAQRSMVTKIVVTFNGPVNLGDGAVSLVRRNGTAIPDVATAVLNPSGDETTWELTFSGPAVIGGSLPDGAYKLVVHGAGVTDLAGNPMTGDYRMKFHRLFGDGNGYRIVSRAELVAMRQAMYQPAAAAWWLDYNGNGLIDVNDLRWLRARLRRAML